MGSTIAEYSVEIGFSKALQNLKKLKTVNQKMNKMNEDSLSRQISLQKRLNALQKGLNVSGGMSPISGVVKAPVVTPKIGVSQKLPPTQDAHIKAREKYLNTQYKEQKALQKAINKLKSTDYLFVSDILTKEQAVTKEVLEQKIGKATSVAHLRSIVATEKANLKNQMRSTKEMEKQNFLLQRLNNSSKQFAGNMVSAFALAAGVTGATKVGQDFEATAIAINTASGSAEAGAKNMEFLRQQARRLGIDYTSSAKGLSQLLAAGEGILAQEDLRNIFLGVSEASTVMGLSVDDTSGAIRAIHQMMSKGKISAKLMVA